MRVERPAVTVESLDTASPPRKAPQRKATTTATVVPQTSVDATARSNQIDRGIYVVAHGDTLYAISRRSGVPLRELAAANRLLPPYALTTGQRLTIPKNRYHKVQAGETLYAIAHAYKVSALEIARQNGIGPSHAIAAGQKLRLPVHAAAPVRNATATVVAATAPAAADATSGSDDAAPVPAAKPAVLQSAVLTPKEIPPPPRRSSSRFAWPVSGRVISSYGAKSGGLHNDGINVAVPAGTPFRSAANGVVTYAGNELRGFGNLVLVRHDGGWVTAYAHASEIDVRVGQTVKRGQVLGRTGSSGHVSSPQLHFEIRRGRAAVDPMRYLAPIGQQRVAVNRSEPEAGRRDPG